MQSIETTGSSASIRGGILDTIVTPPSSATLPPSELAALQIPHSARRPGLKQTASLHDMQNSHSKVVATLGADDSNMATSVSHMSPAAHTGRQQSLNTLTTGSSGITARSAGTQLQHSPSSAALLTAVDYASPLKTIVGFGKGVADTGGGQTVLDVSAGPGSRNATSSDIGRMSSQASSTSSLRAGSRRNSVPQFPMSSAKALLFQASALTDYEQGEM